MKSVVWPCSQGISINVPLGLCECEARSSRQWLHLRGLGGPYPASIDLEARRYSIILEKTRQAYQPIVSQGRDKSTISVQTINDYSEVGGPHL